MNGASIVKRKGPIASVTSPTALRGSSGLPIYRSSYGQQAGHDSDSDDDDDEEEGVVPRTTTPLKSETSKTSAKSSSSKSSSSKSSTKLVSSSSSSKDKWTLAEEHVRKLARDLCNAEYKLSVLEQDKVQEKGINGFAMKNGAEAQKLRLGVFQQKKALRKIFLDLSISYDNCPPVDDDGDKCSACGGEGKLLDCLRADCFRSFHPCCQNPPVDADKVDEESFFYHMCKTIDNCLEDLSVIYGHSLMPTKEFESIEDVFPGIENESSPAGGSTGEEEDFFNHFCGSDYDEDEDSAFDESEFADRYCSDTDSDSSSGSGGGSGRGSSDDEDEDGDDDDDDDHDGEEDDDEEEEEDSGCTTSIDASLVKELSREERELQNDLLQHLGGADENMFGRSKRRGAGAVASSSFATSLPRPQVVDDEDDEEQRELIASCKALKEAKRATDPHLSLNNVIEEKAHGYSTRRGNDHKVINFEQIEAQLQSAGAVLWADDEDDEGYGEEEQSKKKRKRNTKDQYQDEDKDEDQDRPFKKKSKKRREEDMPRESTESAATLREIKSRAAERKTKTFPPAPTQQTVVDLTGGDDEDEEE